MSGAAEAAAVGPAGAGTTVPDGDCCDDPSGAVGSVAPPDDEALAAMAKALGHPARIAILRLLDARRECVTGDVVAGLPLAQSTVSEHLRILREAGLVQGEADGARTRYCVSPTGLAALKSGIASL
jgi:ArsR family transcriptional regulator, arsenate/arsenite/antimonite-responsive transcriptional repressor